MANVYVGFHDQRSCNRILKPPGGGSSNIFGTDRVSEVEPPQKFEKAQNVQQTFQTETIVTQKSVTNQNGTTHTETSKETKVEQNGIQTDENGVSQINGHADRSISKEVFVTNNGTNDFKENGQNGLANKIDSLSLQERQQNEPSFIEAVDSSNTQAETKTIVTSSTVELKTSKTSTSSTIADVLNQDDVAVKVVDLPKKEKPKTPNRVPPGGYSSGLW